MNILERLNVAAVANSLLGFGSNFFFIFEDFLDPFRRSANTKILFEDRALFFRRYCKAFGPFVTPVSSGGTISSPASFSLFANSLSN